jgi:hypothetical protein
MAPTKNSVPCGAIRTAFLHDIHKRFFVRLKRRFFVPAHIPPKAPRAAAVNTRASIQTEATSRSLIKSMHIKRLVQWRVNQANASVH